MVKLMQYDPLAVSKNSFILEFMFEKTFVSCKYGNFPVFALFYDGKESE